MEHKAAYSGGRCLLSTADISELAKLDEDKALVEAEEMQRKYDEQILKSDKKK